MGGRVNLMPVVLRTVLTNSSPIPGLAISWRKLNKLVLTDVGTFWHQTIYPGHFRPSNRARYKHEPRTPVYLREIKVEHGRGAGRFVDQILSGKTRRFTMAFATVRGTARKVTVRMKAPSHVTRPFIGTFRKKDGTLGRVTRQPDKAGELTTVDRRDREQMEEYAAKRYAHHVAQNAKPTTKIL